MTAYVALVAIGNVLMGMMLARYLPPSAIFPQRTSPGSRTDQSWPAPQPEADVEMSQLWVTDEDLADNDQASTTVKPESEENKLREVAPALMKSWADFAQQLRDLKERTRFCRPAQNMQLARQAAEQLRACGQVWYSQFEPCLRGEELDDGAKALIEDAEIGDIEMFAAQIETTLTNIDALDWTGSVDEVLNSLERELDLLDKQQKSVAKKSKTNRGRGVNQSSVISNKNVAIVETVSEPR